MAQAERALSTSPFASPRTMSYRDLNAVDGTIHLPVLMTLALRKARAERSECLAIGIWNPPRRSGASSNCFHTAKTSAPLKFADERSPSNWRDTQIDRHLPRGFA